MHSSSDGGVIPQFEYSIFWAATSQLPRNPAIFGLTIHCVRAPEPPPFAERFVQSIKNEYISQFVVFGERHPEFLIREYEDHYNTVRPHQGIENRTVGIIPLLDTSPPAACESRLGGLLRHYYRNAA